MKLDDLYARPDLLQRMGLTARQNDDGGYHLFETDSMNRVNDPSLLQEALNSVDSRDAQGRLAYGTGGPLTYAGNRFLPGTVDLNGASYTQAEHPYDTLAGIPEYAKYLQQSGVTPNDFSYDETYGNLMANNERTAAYRTLLGNSIAQQNEGGIVDRVASNGPIILGSAALGPMLGPELAGATGLSPGISSALVKAGVGAISGGGPIGALTSLASSGVTSLAGDAFSGFGGGDAPSGGGGGVNVADASGATGVTSDASPAAAGAFDVAQTPFVSTAAQEAGHVAGGLSDALSAGASAAGSAIGAAGSGSGAETDPTVMPTTTVTASPLGEAAMTPERALALTGLGGASALAITNGVATPDTTSTDASAPAPATESGGDNTGAFDQGQFSPADVGLQTDTGAFDMGQFTAADVGLGATPLSNMSFPGGGGGGDGFSNSGDSSSSTDSQAFYEEAANTDTVSDPFNASNGVQSALDKALKFGPLGLGIAGLLSQSKAKNETQRFAQQIAQIGGPQRAVGQQLLNDFQSGTLNPADASRINSWEQSALAQARQYFARAGTSTGTSANATYRDIAAKAEQMRQQALQTLLTQGLNALNITDKFQADAIKAELQADTAARAQTLSFMNSLGNITARLPAILGSTEKTVGA